jgi:hypothetical protein
LLPIPAALISAAVRVPINTVPGGGGC